MIFRRSLAVLLLGLLVACGSPTPPNPQCIMANDFEGGAKEFKVYAQGGGSLGGDGAFRQQYNGWLYTGMDILPDKELTIEVTNKDTDIDLCVGGAPQVSDVTSSVSVTNDGWTDTGVSIAQLQEYAISVEGNWQSCSAASGCSRANGLGLYAYIGDSVPSNWQSLDSSKQSFLGSDGELFNSNYPTSDPQYLRLYDAENPGYYFTTGGIDATGHSSPSGNLFLRYIDSDGDYSDNSGGYTIKVTKFKQCKLRNGNGLVAYFGEKPQGNEASHIQAAAPTSFSESNSIMMANCSTPGAAFGQGDCGDNIYPRAKGLFVGKSPVSEKKHLWLKIIDTDGANGDGVYTPYNINTGEGSNKGHYDVIVRAPVEKIKINSVINYLIQPVVTALHGSGDQIGALEVLYKGVTFNGRFVDAVRALMVLAVVFFAFKYMLGLSNITQKELLILCFKLALMIVLISPESWDFFYYYFFSFFIEGVHDLIYIMSISISDSVTLPTIASVDVNNMPPIERAFLFVNETVSLSVSSVLWAKIAALLGSLPLGFIYGVLVVIGMLIFWLAIIKAVFVYLRAIILTALLIFMAPLFFIFLLFEKTKDIFEKWVKMLMDFMLQSILVVMMLSILCIFIYSAFYSIFGFAVCWGCVTDINLGITDTIGLGSWDKFCLIHGYTPWGISTGSNVETAIIQTPVSWFAALIFLILSSAMIKFNDFVVKVSGAITIGGTFSVGLSESQSGGFAKGVTEAAKDTAGAVSTTAKGLAGGAGWADKMTGKNVSGFVNKRAAGASAVMGKVASAPGNAASFFGNKASSAGGDIENKMSKGVDYVFGKGTLASSGIKGAGNFAKEGIKLGLNPMKPIRELGKMADARNYSNDAEAEARHTYNSLPPHQQKELEFKAIKSGSTVDDLMKAVSITPEQQESLLKDKKYKEGSSSERGAIRKDLIRKEFNKFSNPNNSSES